MGRIFTVLTTIFLLGTTLLKAQTADFSANITTGCTPLLIQYTDLSTSPNGIASWSWDFGDGTFTTVTNPVKLYSTGGTFTICLTITDSLGLTDTECKTDYISVADNPTANFSANNLSDCNPLTTQFTDLSTNGTNNIVSWQWSFGDGATSSLQNPTHTYTADGPKNVTLTVTDQNGCVDQEIKGGYITVNQNPVANFTVNDSIFCSSPATVNFTNTSSVPSGANMAYNWDFGDGNTSTLANPSHTYNSLGDYTVTLTATNQATGCSDVLVMTDLISVINSTTLVFDHNPTQGCGTLAVNFTNLTACPTSNWHWDFGDPNATNDTSNLENSSYTYTTPGCYTVTFSAIISGVQSSITTTTCIQVDSVPNVSYSTPDTLISCSLPHTVNLTGQTDIANPTWSWDFGDGNTSNLQNPSHTYTSGGVFPISLTVTSPQGCSRTIVTDTMYSRPIEADYLADLSAICSGDEVNFVDTSTSFYPIISWQWDFGDTTSTDPDPNITFNDTGLQNITLIVTNNQGCSDTTMVETILVGDTLDLLFATNDTLPCVEDDVVFQNLTDPANIPFLSDWSWDFGDGNTSSSFQPTHNYEDTGSYTVRLTAQYFNCKSEYEIVDYVRILGPKADFLVDRDCASPLTVNFINESEGGDRWFWDFGVTTATNDTSNLENPSYTYPGQGTYTARLLAINDLTGCTHEKTVTFTLTPAEDVNVSLAINSGCAPLDIVVLNTSSQATYAWTAPGATIDDSTAAQPLITYDTPGTYDSIQVVVTHPNGCVETVVISDPINVTVAVSDITPFFTASATTGCVPLNVQFTDQSTSTVGPIVSWYWIFGDGDTASIQNPNHTYDTAGAYDVFLIAADTTGCTRTHRLATPIVPTAPGITMTIDTFGCSGQTLSFSGSGTGVGLGYMWDFGDGNTANGAMTTHAFMTEGMYNVCLTVTDINGCQNTVCDSVTVGNPMAEFSANNTTSVCQSLTVQFIDQSTNAVSWLWDFGDGNSSTLQNPVYVYNNGGDYDVCLVVTNLSGCQDTICKPSFISVTGPGANYTYAPDTGCPGTTVTFNITGFNVQDYTFAFGDFTSQNFTGSGTTDTFSITHTYQNGGSYLPTLLIDDGAGCVRSLVGQDTIGIEDFDLEIQTSDTIVCGSGTVQLTYNAATLSPVNSVQWSFNSSFSTADTVNTLLSVPGIYPISLTASNASCSVTTTDTVVVKDMPMPNFGATPNTGCNPETIMFSDSSTILNDSIVSYAWSYGTGDTDSIQNTSYEFLNFGNFPVQLTVTTLSGCIDSVTQTITINQTPTADAGQDVTICDGSTTQLQATGGATYQWMTDPTLSCLNCANPIASPTADTWYYVTATSAQGCSAMDSVFVSVVGSPTASISNGPFMGCTGTAITFLDGSTTPGGTISNWNWDFGDNNTSASQNPSHIYANTGNYTATLIVTATTGCKDTTTTIVTISQAPLANAVASNYGICRGDTVQLTATGGVSYQWSPTTGLTCGTCPDPQAAPLSTTTYTVTVTGANGCTATDTVGINVSSFPLPVLTLSNDTTICAGDVIQLFASGGSSPLDYTWDASRTGLSCYIHCSNPFASPTVTTTYVVTLTGQGGCTTTDSITVNVVTPNQSIINIGDQTVCRGDALQLDITQGVNPEWFPFDGLSCVFCPNPIATPDTTTTYSVTVLNVNGCYISDTITLTILDPDDISAGDDIQICPGQSTQLMGSGNGIVAWTGDTTLSDPTILNPTVTPSVTTDYYLTVDNGTCIVTDTVRVTVTNKANIEGQDVTICENDSIQLEVTPGADTYTWFPSTGLSDTTIHNPIASPSETTTYTVIGTLQSCEADTTTITVTVSPAPIVTGFDIQNTFFGQVVPVKLNVEVNPTFTYQWTPSTDLTCDQCATPILTANQEETYTVSVTNREGCNTTDSISIQFLNDCSEDIIVVPTGFSPNGDGVNDVLYVRGSAISDPIVFRIYSRNGELVFTSSNMNSGWDGVYNGQIANPGVFVYYVEATCPQTGNIIQKRGNVTLIR